MKLKDNNDPYFQQISEYFYSQFPNVAQPTDCELLEIITTILVGTKDIRYGSMPSPESLVVIRKTIRESIENGHAIPILVPWGSLKAVNNGDDVDVAEVMAIQRLVKTNNAVKQFHEPGLDIVIRVEDTSGRELFALDMTNVDESITKYCDDFTTMVSILSGNTIRVLKESEMKGANDFVPTQKILTPFFEKYLEDSAVVISVAPSEVYKLKSYKDLQTLGWQGTISNEQRSFYYDSYTRNYTDQSLNTRRLALYMAQSLARHKLNMSGKQDYWKSFIQITFVQPVKGLPEGYHANALYYRTIPMSQGRTHICPWRAKGYLKISKNVCAKITSAHDPIELFECKLTLADEAKSVDITVRYIIED